MATPSSGWKVDGSAVRRGDWGWGRTGQHYKLGALCRDLCSHTRSHAHASSMHACTHTQYIQTIPAMHAVYVHVRT